MPEEVDYAIGWLEENQWAIGVIYLLFGPLIAFFGAKWFPYITASLCAIFLMTLTAMLSSQLGWMDTTLGAVLTIIGALAIGIAVGCFVRRCFKVMLGLLGLVAGFFSGSLVFALISGMTGGEWKAVWGFWVVSAVLAIVGCVLAIYLGMPLVMFSTACIGSYLFMRAWTLFFPGNYPNEWDLIDPETREELDMGAMFWLFVGIFVVSFAFTLTFQCKSQDHHEDLDQLKDDNYKRA